MIKLKKLKKYFHLFNIYINKRNLHAYKIIIEYNIQIIYNNKQLVNLSMNKTNKLVLRNTSTMTTLIV